MSLLFKEGPSPGYQETLEEITKLYRSLPPRPTVEEVEAAASLVKTVNHEEKERLEEIFKQFGAEDVPAELFSVFQEVRKSVVLFGSREQREEAIHLLEFDEIFQTVDELVRRASKLGSGDNVVEEACSYGCSPDSEIGKEVVISDEKPSTGEESVIIDATKSSVASPVFMAGETEKLSLMKVAAVIEISAKSEAEFLDLQCKLMDKVEWLPLSLGKLSHLVELNIAENQIMALPSTINGLKSLRKLDIHSNQLINLPDSFGELIGLTHLDLHSNWLKSLPASFGNLKDLMDLDLSANQFRRLPDLVGDLISLRKLNVVTNDLEELPYTIGSCASLVELRLDFNELRALPEALGKLHFLEILTLHYNRITGLPKTMGNLAYLQELDASFNELESVPESLCLAVSLKKMNLGNNFADLRALPITIGMLEMLEELDISYNQIRELPDSFRLLKNLRVLHADETPLEVPPMGIANEGAQAVVDFMAEFVAQKDLKLQTPTKKRGFILQLLACCFGLET